MKVLVVNTWHRILKEFDNVSLSAKTIADRTKKISDHIINKTVKSIKNSSHEYFRFNWMNRLT